MGQENLGLIYRTTNAFLKNRYVDNDFIYGQLYGESTLLGMIASSKKSGKVPGRAIEYPIKVGGTNHTSASFVTAQTGAKTRTGSRAKFSLTFDADFHDVARISSKMMGATREKIASFVDQVEEEVSDVYNAVIRSISGALYRSDSYKIGSTATNSGVDNGANTVVLDADSVQSFLELDVGMEVEFATSAAVGTSLGTTYITKLDLATRTITFNDLPDAVVNTADATIDLFYNGGRNVSGWSSLDDWIPGAASDVGSLGGLDRSIHPTLLGGYRYTAPSTSATTGTPILNALQRAVTVMLANYRGTGHLSRTSMAKNSQGKYCYFINPIVHQLLTDELGDKVRYNKTEGKTSEDARTFGFSTISLFCGGIEVPVYSDSYCPIEQAWAIHKDTWAINWIGGGEKEHGPVHLFSMPEGGYIKTAHDGAGIEARVEAFPLLGCFAPGLNCRVNLSGISKIGSY